VYVNTFYGEYVVAGRAGIVSCWVAIFKGVLKQVYEAQDTVEVSFLQETENRFTNCLTHIFLEFFHSWYPTAQLTSNLKENDSGTQLVSAIKVNL
jgi:hypothetical protein